MSKYAHELAAGDPIEHRKFTVSSVANQQRLFAQEDYHSRYLPSASGEPEIVHPALVIQMLANTSSPSYRVPENIGPTLGEAQTTFIHSLCVGQEYSTSWRITRRYVKRAKEYQEIKAEITDADGKIAARRTMQITYAEHSGAISSKGLFRQSTSTESQHDSSTEKTSRARQISLARMLAFSGGEIGAPHWPASNLHTDLAKARRAGLQNTIASGIQAEGYLIAMILDEVGEIWLSGGTLSVKHIGMLSPGDIVISKLNNRVDKTKRQFDVRCERPDGRLIVVGEALLDN